MVFPVVHVWMWELDHKEGWVLKNWSFWTVVLEETLESPLDCKEIKQVNLKGNQPWIIIARTGAEAEVLILGPPDVKSWLIWKDPDAGKDWRQEKGTTEDEMVEWHHRLNGHEFEQGPAVGDGQGGLACCNPWGRKESDTTEQLNWTEGRKERRATSSLPHELSCERAVSCPASFLPWGPHLSWLPAVLLLRAPAGRRLACALPPLLLSTPCTGAGLSSLSRGLWWSRQHRIINHLSIHQLQTCGNQNWRLMLYSYISSI